MKFEINTIGKLLVRRQKKEVPKFIWGGLILLFVFIVGVRYGMDDKSFQTIMYIWAGLISFTIMVVGPIYVRSRITRVIQKVEFTDKKIIIETEKAGVILTDTQIRKVCGYFKGFGRSHMSGYIIKSTRDSKEYWLINTFFNDIEMVEEALRKYL